MTTIRNVSGVVIPNSQNIPTVGSHITTVSIANTVASTLNVNSAIYATNSAFAYVANSALYVNSATFAKIGRAHV